MSMMLKFLERTFVKGLKEKVDRETMEQLLQRYRKLCVENRHWVVDKPSEINLMYSALVLATYQTLKGTRPDEEVFDVIRWGFFARTQEKQQRVMRLSLKLMRNPFGRIVKISKVKQVKHYGDKQFTHEIQIDNDNEYLMHVTKCFYHNFFTAHGAPEITPVFCEADNVWGDLLDPETNGVKFDRSMTLGQGHAYCRFHFTKTKPMV
jgi:hypothetical protein